VAEMLETLHKVRRGLTSLKQRPLTKVSIYFVIGSVQELFDAPSYCLCAVQSWYRLMKMSGNVLEHFDFDTCGTISQFEAVVGCDLGCCVV
jgi:hypothetical protein